jgi:hypothetical protein
MFRLRRADLFTTADQHVRGVNRRYSQAMVLTGVARQQYSQLSEGNGRPGPWGRYLESVPIPTLLYRLALLVQNNIKKGFVDLDFAVVVDESQLPELCHEQIHACAS